MPDTKFQLDSLPVFDEQHAARLAVLYPLAVRTDHAKKEALAAAWANLLVQWRARTLALRDAGWEPFDGDGGPTRLAYARNCWPDMAVIVASAPTRPCHQRHVCPWCYARRVRALFRAVMTNAGDGVRLFHGFGRVKVAPRDDLAHALEHYARLLRKIVLGNSLDNRGTAWAMTVEPRMTHEGGWTVTRRVLALLGPEHKGFELIPDGWVQHTAPAVTGPAAVTAVSKAWRYPVGLMHGDAERAVRALHARKPFRLQEFSGCLRGVEKGRDGV
jgi:hypothetical protein